MKFTCPVIAAAVAYSLTACSRESAARDTASPAVVADTPAATLSDSALCVLTDSAIGKVRLGMTIGDAEAAWPASAFSRTSDGEGVALVEVKAGGETMMTVFAGEDGPSSALDPARRIEHIEAFSSSCSTAHGIRPGMLVSDAEKILGKVGSISKSEIESREFVQFTNHPARLTIRLDYTGIFGPDSAETTRFAPEARILSIAISSRR